MGHLASTNTRQLRDEEDANPCQSFKGFIYYYLLVANPRVAHDNYFYGGFIKKNFTI